MFGLTLEDYKGRSAIDFVHPDDLELVGRSLVSIQNKEIGPSRSAGQDAVRLAPAGTDRRSGELVHRGAVLFTIRDLTERRRFEVAHNEDDRFRSLIHNAGNHHHVGVVAGRDRMHLSGVDENAGARPRTRRVHAAERHRLR